MLARTHIEPDLQFAVSRFAGYCFIAVGFFFAFKVVHLDLSSLAVIVGGLGIGIGFGLQNIVSNFVSGLIILAERPIAIGHRVEVGGVAGQVTKISLRSTVVVTNDNITIIVPNSNFITNPVTNWSYGDPKVRLRLPVGRRLRQRCREAAAGVAGNCGGKSGRAQGAGPDGALPRIRRQFAELRTGRLDH